MHKAEQLNNTISRLIAATDPAETQQIYKEWAHTYNEDLDGFGYLAPKIGAVIFQEAFPNREALILDAGCGTGLVGQALAGLGYTQFHGVDFSKAMLEQAKKSGHYANLMEADFFQTLAIADDTYDAVISIGVYASRMSETFIPELMRIIQSGGILCMSCRLHYFEAELHEQIKAHESNGLLTIESITQKPYMQAQNADAAYLVLKKRGHRP